MARKGILIVLEGTDGSGKGTQVKLLGERLKENGYPVFQMAFPQYGKKSAGLVEEYLNGNYGKPDEIDPYAGSLFFALDRFDGARKIREELEHGSIVLLDRYIDSNIGHQGGKIRDENDRGVYVEWLYDLEFRILKNPRPDLVLVIHMPPSVGQELIKKKAQREYITGGKTHDIHEADLKHLTQAEEAFIWLVKKFPKTHKIIESYTERLLTPEEVNEKIWHEVEGLVMVNA